MRQQTFELKPEHVTLLRAAYVDWNGDEWGAPSINPKRPFGNGNVWDDMHELLKFEALWDGSDGMPAELQVRYQALYRELETALQVVLATGSFEPGVYEAPLYGRAWSRRDG